MLPLGSATGSIREPKRSLGVLRLRPYLRRVPLHSLQRLSPTAVLGLWHRTEAPAALWALLPPGLVPGYQTRQPATADAARRGQWLAARVLLHRVLAAVLPAPAGPVWLENAASGRPRLCGAVPPAAAVALSHSGEWAAVLVCTAGPVGVDVELVRDKAQRLAGKFLNPAEAAAAALTPTAAHYTLLWSAKETLYKLAGRPGLIFKAQLLLGAFAAAGAGTIPGTVLVEGQATRHLVCYCQPAAGYVLTYALSHPNPCF